MYFATDNAAGIPSARLDAIGRANDGYALNMAIRKRPGMTEALRSYKRSGTALDYAAARVSTTLLFWTVLMRMVRGFIASGTSRTSSTCSRPFSSTADFTSTKSANRKTRSNARAAMPW